MVDLASLRISVDSRDVKKADADLAEMSNTAGRTAAAVDRLSTANNRLAEAVASSHKPTIDAVKYINQLEYELQSVGKSASELKQIEIQMAAARAPTAALASEIRQMGSALINAKEATDRAAAAQRAAAAAQQAFNNQTNQAQNYIERLNFELASVGKSSLQLKALEIRMAAARAPTAELSNEIRSLGAQMLVAERNAQRATGTPTTGITGMGGSSKLAGHHAQNLAFQLQDVFVSLASGQKPMMVFMQQGTQIAGIMGQAGLSVGGLIKQIAGMVGSMTAAIALNPAFLALAAVVGTAYVAFKDFQKGVDDSGRLKEYAKTLGLTADEMKKLGPVTITAGDVVKGLWKTISDGLGLQKVFSAIGKFFTDLFRGIASTSADLMAGMYGLFVGTYRGIVKVWDMLPAAFGDLTISAVNATIRALNGMVNKAIDVINSLISGANKILSALKMPTLGLLADVNIPELENQYKGAASRAGNAFLGEIKTATTQARGAMAGIGSTIGENIVISAEERLAAKAGGIIDERSASKMKDAAGNAGKSAGEKFAEELTKGVSDTLGNLMASSQAFSADFLKDFGKGSTDEMKKIVEDIDKARARAAEKVAQDLANNIKTATDGAQMIADIIGGGIGAGVKQLSDVLAKNFPDFMGSLGKAFGGIKDSLDGLLGSLGTNFKELGAGAQVGTAVNSIVGGSKTGAQVGGAIGNAAFGPVGAIAGSILGSVVGGLFKKTKSASATIAAEAGKLDVAGLVGNNAQFKQTANTLAGAVIGGLNNAANALGAEITNAINISIGQRKDKFVVDTLGLGRTKGSGTMAFASEAEAIQFAIDKAIRDGIFGGLRAGTERLLKGFGDVEDRLAKAVDFENVFKAMKANVDPVGAALEGLDKRFAALIETFREAGATSEEWATLEKYYQQERLKTIEEANKAAIEKTNAARDALISAYDRESAAILTTLERFQSLTANLESFRLSLAEQLMTAEEIYKQSRAKFEEISKAAIAGNEQAISELVGVSQRYLDAAKQFLTPEEYNREIQNVMKAVDLAIVQTKTMEEYAQSQLDALNASVSGLMKLDESVLSVADAIKDLQGALGEQNRQFAETQLQFQAQAAAANDNMQAFYEDALRRSGYYSGTTGATSSIPGFASGGMFDGGLRVVGENGPEIEATGASRIYNAAQTAEILSGGLNVATQIANMRSEMKASLYAIAKNTGKTTDQLQRWDGDGMPEVRDWAA